MCCARGFGDDHESRVAMNKLFESFAHNCMIIDDQHPVAVWR
jgi:hypothetical protein